MSKKKRNASKWKRPYPHKEEAEFGKPKAGILSCKRCGAFFYKKSWHHRLNVRDGQKKRTVGYIWCPACAMIANRQYEGKVMIERIPARFLPALRALIAAYGERAYRRDPQHRLIETKWEDDKFIATTTENQLAARLGKKIKEVFNRVDLHIGHATAPSDAARVRVIFREPTGNDL